LDKSEIKYCFFQESKEGRGRNQNYHGEPPIQAFLKLHAKTILEVYFRKGYYESKLL